MNGYMKYFDNGGKNMSFVTDDKKVYEKYDEIWKVVKGLLKLKSTAGPIRDDKYILPKLKIFKKKNLTTFNNNNIVPMEKNHYICIPAIDIDSVLIDSVLLILKLLMMMMMMMMMMIMMIAMIIMVMTVIMKMIFNMSFFSKCILMINGFFYVLISIK